MTTTVKAGTNRPAAKARTAKAAQNTALPAKETPREEYLRLVSLPLLQQTKAIQARIRKLGNLPENTGFREDPAATPYESMTVAQLREAAHAAGLSPSTRTPKAKLVELLNAKTPASVQETLEETLPATPEPTPAPVAAKAPKTSKKAAQPKPSADAPASKGQPKAEALGAELEPFGWKVLVTVKAGDRAEFSAKRGEEALLIVWDGGVFNYDGSLYTNGTRSLRPRNVSAARQRCAVPAE